MMVEVKEFFLINRFAVFAFSIFMQVTLYMVVLIVVIVSRRMMLT